ncbi:MAG: glutathione S-transferase [Sphingomonadales bacterium]|nr:glutathione S-transferase [Sphingomonadales bacterium]
MRLFYTPRSHFSRKVRILLSALNLNVELMDAGNVADSDHEPFGPNPLMKVPTLVDGSQTIIESDHIAQYLVNQYDPGDRFGVLTQDVQQLNARSVMNGVMAAEVELILAQRTGIETDKLQRFNKIRESIVSGLNWLEQHPDHFPEEPTYSGFHLVCMWDHLKFYDTVPLHHTRLEETVALLSERNYVADTAPR